MAKTPNLGLTLTGTSESDSNQTFLNWRTDMSGVGPGSNMQLIDAAYGNLRQAQEDAADDIADLKDAVDELSALSDDVDDISQPYNLVTTHSRATFFVDPNNAYIQVDDSSPGEYNIWVARVEPGKTYAVLTDESPITYLLWMVSPIEVLGEDEIGIGNPLMDGATLLTSGSNIITIPNNANNKFIAFRSSNGFTNGMVAECFAEPGYGTAETKTANDVMARAETKALKQEVADTKDVVMSAFVANTVSGTAISFDDGADDVPVGSFIIDIEATQSGSGDPSPDNVRTIVGRTSTTVTQHGKNLANVVDNTYTSSGVTLTSANGAVRMSGTSTGTINRTIGTVQLLAGVKYIISGTKSSGIADSDTLRIDLRTSSGSVIASGNSYDGFAYTPNEDIIAQVNIRFVSGQTINATIYPQVEAGEAATDFEPYVMISRMIDWSDVAGPIFHGTLDVLTGQLTVDRILFQTTWGAGTIQKTKNDIITKAFSLPMSYSIATGAPASSKCNVCTYKVSMSAYTESAFQFVMQQESGAYRWKLVMGLPSSTLDDQTIQVAYIVDEPAIYHLAPTEVRTLLGTNIISASSDNITLKYCASPSSIKNAIDDLVKVQATQPVEPDNKIWFDTDIDDEYTVPDYAEFTEVKGDVEDLKSQMDSVGEVLATEYELISQSNQTGSKLLDTGYRTSDADYTIFAFPVIAGYVYQIITPHMAQFQTLATVPSSGTLRRVGETYTAGTYIVNAPETAKYLVISTPNSGTYGAYCMINDIGDRLSALQNEADKNGFIIKNQALPTEYKTYNCDYGTATSEGRAFKVTGAGVGGAAPQGRYFDHFDVSANDKVYLYGECSVNADNCVRIRLGYCGINIEQANPVKDTVYILSNVITCTNVTNKNRISGYEAYSSISAATNAVLSVDNLILVNLTAIYGAGNEPDKAYMDTLVANAGWFQALNLFDGKTVLDSIAALCAETDMIDNNVFVEFENGFKYASPSNKNDGSGYVLNNNGTNVSISAASRGNDGDIIYAWGEFKVLSTESCSRIGTTNVGNERTVIENPDNDVWYPMSARYYRKSDTTAIQFSGNWASNANIRLFYKHVVSINLTQVFGQYNEPSRDLLDKYFLSVSQSNAMDFEAVNAKMLNLGDSTRMLSHPSGSYVVLDEERNVKMGSMPDANWTGWQEIGTYGQFNVSAIPVYNKIHGTIETDGMVSVLPIWGAWSEAASSGNTHHGGHVFHGWTTDRQHRLTMVQNIYRDDEAAVFNYIPGDKSGTSEGVFLRLRLGADNNYKGVLIENEYGGTNNTDYHLARMTVYGRLNITRHSNYNNIPASASADGVKGDICVDGNYIYVCTDTNVWKRVPLETW